MKEEIIELLGKNSTTIEFTSVKNYNEVYGLYTYKNDVYVLKGGMDLEFDELSSNEQTNVLKMVKLNQWKYNKTLQ